MEPESDDFVPESVLVSEPSDESDPLEPADFSELDRLSCARVSVL